MKTDYRLAATLILAGALGCSDNATTTEHPGSTGGSAGAGGSVAGAGGTTSAAGAGGTLETGGSTAAGGSSATGGSTAAGGSSATGGSTAAGGSSATGGSSGTGGSTVDAGPSPPPRDGGPVVWQACTQPPCITQINNCSIPIWVHPWATAPGIDGGTVRKLNPGESFQYSGFAQMNAGRIYAHYKDPGVTQSTALQVNNYFEYVEATVIKDKNGVWWQNYDISDLDSTAMGVSMAAVPLPGQKCGVTQCDMTFDQIVSGCPTQVDNLYNGVGQCMGSYNYCIQRDPAGGKNDAGQPNTYDDTKEYCYKMAKPADPANGITVPQPGSHIYGGIFVGQKPTVAYFENVAGWQRGTTGGNWNAADYYITEPYNDFAKWLHVTHGCNVYAFANDDHQNQSGFVSCQSNELRVLWCPNGQTPL
jgi:hypothetical protein